MKKIDCPTAQSWIIEHLDQGLDAAALVCLQRHIEHCPGCRRTYDESVDLFSNLRAGAAADPGEDFWSHYDTSLKAALHEHELDREQWRFPWRKMSAALAGGIIALTLALGVVYRSIDRTPRPQDLGPKVVEELDALYGPTSEEEMNVDAASTALATGAAGTAMSDAFVPWFEVEEDPYPLLSQDRKFGFDRQSLRGTGRKVASVRGATIGGQKVPTSTGLAHSSLRSSKSRRHLEEPRLTG